MDPLKQLITLLALLNPIGVIPFFIHFTRDLNPAQRRRTIWVCALTVFCVMAVSGLAGLQVLEFFGISLASFQVGGGILLLINAIQMLNAEPADSNPRDVASASEKLDAGDSMAISPLTIPLLTGPATLSTMVIYSQQASGLTDYALLVSYGVAGALVTFAAFMSAERITRLLKQTGINVLTRVMGLILAAVGVEIMADGLLALFPILGGT